MSWHNDETVPFEPEDRAEQALQRYAERVHGVPPPEFIDRVMAAVEQAPAPRRGILGLIAALPAAWHRPLHAVALVAVLVAGVVGTIAAGELLISFRSVGNQPSSPPSVAPATVEPSATSQPTPSLRVTPSPTPDPSDRETAAPTERDTPDPSETGKVETPEPTETSEPTETPEPAETPEPSDDHGGDDNSGHR